MIRVFIAPVSGPSVVTIVFEPGDYDRSAPDRRTTQALTAILEAQLRGGR